MVHAHHVASGSHWVAACMLLVLTAFVYLRGWIQLRSAYPPMISAWRAGTFLLGLFLILLAIAPPLAGTDHELLTFHMIQHLLLMTLAPPLIWLGDPLVPLLHALLCRVMQTVVAPLFRSAPMQRVGSVLARPAIGWLGASATLIGWHIPAMFMLGMQSPIWHGIELASFLASGLLFWYPVIQPRASVARWPEWSILLYLFSATLPCDILSGFLVFCDRVVYPFYFSSLPKSGLSALEDQECAGALMWTCVTLVYLVPAAILSNRLLSPRSFYRSDLVQSELHGGAASQRDSQRLEAF